jgi:hypothetical protein
LVKDGIHIKIELDSLRDDMAEVGNSRLQQVFNANVIELAKDPEVDLIFIIDSVDEFTGFHPGYDIVVKGVDNSDFGVILVDFGVGRQVVKSLPYFRVEPFPELSYSFGVMISK